MWGANGEDAEVLAAISVNLPVVGVLIAGYIVLHILFEPYFYNNATAKSREASRKGKPAPPKPPSGRLRSITSCFFAFKVDDQTFIECAGIDAYAYVEFIRCALRVLVLFASARP